MKIVLKSHMHKEKKQEEVKAERDVLVSTRHPNIIRLFYSFRDAKRLYFVLEYAPNGSLADLLKLYNRLPLPLAKHYAAEIVNALEYLHSKGIAHRDLKPENIMLSDNFHVKLADFGTAKFMADKIVSGQVVSHKGYAFVGTPEYVSPEVLLNKESGPASDLWALGCMLHQFLAGATPFTNKTEYLIFQSVLKGLYEVPQSLPAPAANIIKRLLVIDPSERLGSGPENSPLSYEELKKHEFFEGVNFEEIGKMELGIDKEKRKKLQEQKQVDSDEGDSYDEEEKMAVASTESNDVQFKVLKEGIILQKTGIFFYNKRKVVLTSKPELSFYDLDKNAHKGDVMLSRAASIVAAKKKFQVRIGKHTFKFEGSTKAVAEEWVQAIKDAIHRYCPD
eukprot:TRINITY_DN8455_c0_g1_i1.p1 TRINITY_DN8455_c0_g1~~TRINITY_DN8455_c0_g1_i1.p1  ORF type:complete len:392 (+),score=90.99 TRINITY_DN8455_c0_g1_i1:412-1587(+)